MTLNSGCTLATFGEGLFLFVCFFFLQIRLSVVYLMHSSTCPPMDSNLMCLGCNSGIDIFQAPVVTVTLPENLGHPALSLRTKHAEEGELQRITPARITERSQSSPWTTPGHHLCLEFVGYVYQNIMLGWCHFKFNFLLM